MDTTVGATQPADHNESTHPVASYLSAHSFILCTSHACPVANHGPVTLWLSGEAGVIPMKMDSIEAMTFIHAKVRQLQQIKCCEAFVACAALRHCMYHSSNNATQLRELSLS